MSKITQHGVISGVPPAWQRQSDGRVRIYAKRHRMLRFVRVRGARLRPFRHHPQVQALRDALARHARHLRQGEALMETLVPTMNRVRQTLAHLEPQWERINYHAAQASKKRIKKLYEFAH